jgi:hypothetical protein
MTYPAPKFRFSGHETFPCRYAWLPKAVSNLNRDPQLFADEDTAMVELGVGKNMVKAIRFWTDASGVALSRNQAGMEVSPLGHAIFGTDGYDPYMEDIQTLWLLHWMLSSANDEPLFAWHHLLNFWHRPDFSRTEALQTFDREAQLLGKKLSLVTLDHHFTTFLHTYLPTRGGKGDILEDNLDCPLTELNFITKIGDRSMADSGRRESIYAFRVEEKVEISAELFVYCLADYWQKRHPSETTLSFRDVAVGVSSPGQVFKLPEVAVRDRLEDIEKASGGAFQFRESSALPQLVRRSVPSANALLARIYNKFS